ncbi:hypothetical protein G3G77_002017 [Salmonella enterica]|nr:hypothetical protein [Salmonella enterica]EDU6365907.1 hypothetical protein [Salmonella enterica subsp. houtenae serovar 40:z4,z24:-]HBZ8550755.1 hypothetical protein [Salmonella enterica subsp. houtenae]EEG5670961.1 hypothetical protein [Salmonella enterica]EEH5466199.1 hypothetical protein [Salmonella enterica]
MLTIDQLFKGVEMIKFQDFREKYSEILKAEDEEKERFQQVAEMIVSHFEKSLDLEHPGYPSPFGGNLKDLAEDAMPSPYVSIVTEKGGRHIEFNELKPDEKGVLSFCVCLIVDKSPISYPKKTLSSRLSLRRNGDGFTVTVGEDALETDLSKSPSEAELAGISEAAKHVMLIELSSGTPKRKC